MYLKQGSDDQMCVTYGLKTLQLISLSLHIFFSLTLSYILSIYVSEVLHLLFFSLLVSQNTCVYSFYNELCWSTTNV